MLSPTRTKIHPEQGIVLQSTSCQTGTSFAWRKIPYLKRDVSFTHKAHCKDYLKELRETLAITLVDYRQRDLMTISVAGDPCSKAHFSM
jgi:hypothetical protein